ncbi:MAG: glycosyltransferase family 2 protein [Patescibacteria group bacterium]|nr:glycosyltransferase family 2 protein [Patescibacteria group bacterium]
MPTLTSKKISVVVPCYNEQENLERTYGKLKEVLLQVTPNYEIVFADNGSTDASEPIYRKLAAADPRVVVVMLSRNFGSPDHTYTAGTEHTSGDAVVWADADLQDPPEMIPQFVKKWISGYDVVYGIRSRRAGNPIRNACYKLFYRLMKSTSYLDIPLDVSEFSLMDRKVVNVINAMPERNRFVRGLRAWAGFRATGIPYFRGERTAGKTKFTFWTYIRTARKGLFSFSYAPLEWITTISGILVVVTSLALLFYLGGYIFGYLPEGQRGIRTIILMVLFFGTVQLLSLSIIGEYLGRIFEEVKHRPKYVVREVLNNPRARP